MNITIIAWSRLALTELPARSASRATQAATIFSRTFLSVAQSVTASAVTSIAHITGRARIQTTKKNHADDRAFGHSSCRNTTGARVNTGLGSHGVFKFVNRVQSSTFRLLIAFHKLKLEL